MMTTQKTNKNDKCDDDVERPRHLIEMRLLNSKVFVADFRNYFYQMRSAMCTLNKAYNECEGDKQEPSWDDMIDVSGVASDMNVGIPLGGSSSSGACAHTSSITMVDADVSANDTCVPAVSPLSEAEHHDILRKVVDECLRSSPEQRQFHLQILNMQVSEDSVLVHRFMCETGCVGVCLEELRKDESVVNCQMATNILVRLSMIPFGADAIMASDFACLVKHAKDQPFDRCEIARDCAMIMANIIRRSSGQVMKYLGDSLKAWLESEVTLNDRTLAMRIRGCSHQLGITSGALSPVAKTTKLVFTETAAGAS